MIKELREDIKLDFDLQMQIYKEKSKQQITCHIINNSIKFSEYVLCMI